MSHLRLCCCFRDSFKGVFPSSTALRLLTFYIVGIAQPCLGRSYLSGVDALEDLRSFHLVWVCHVVAAIDRKSCAPSLSLSQLVRASLSLNLSLARCVCVCICISVCACLYLFVLPLLDLPLTLALPLFRSVSAAERCLSPIGRPGLRRADTTLAVSAGAAR